MEAYIQMVEKQYAIRFVSLTLWLYFGLSD